MQPQLQPVPGNAPATTHERALRPLRLDPPALLRAIRAAVAPIYMAHGNPWRIEDIGQALGPSLTRRVLEVPVADLAGTSLLRRLWLHSIATAHAAQAQSSRVLLHHQD